MIEKLLTEEADEVSQFLIGQYEVRVGAKGRIHFPEKFKAILGVNLVVTRGYEKSLIVVGQSHWKTLLEGTEGKPFVHPEARETQRFLLGEAAAVELDDKGRFIIPSYLRDYGKIENEAVFIGLSRYVEIWDKNRWQSYRKEIEGKIGDITQRLVEK